VVEREDQEQSEDAIPTGAISTPEDIPEILDTELEADGDRARPVRREVFPPVEDFQSLAIDPELSASIQSIGWSKPTPVQGMCLPYTVAGRDVAGFAQTGTGKTGVFLISIAHKIFEWRKAKQGVKTVGPLAVVMAPTRELAMQIENDASTLFEKLNIRTMAVFGGVDYDKQAKQLRDGCDVVFATPGRLKDYFQKREFNFNECQVFVCDEADRMLDMGFIEDVEFFLDKLPETTQKLLFSATTNDVVKELAFEYLEQPEYISVNPEVLTPENIEQTAVAVPAEHKLRVLLGLWQDQAPSCAIVFTNTKLVADWLHFKLVNNGINADLITGDLPQRKRIQLIKKIKQGEIKALVATDVASRGLHIAGVTHVFNFDLPDDASNYIHRIGRTARAGAKGKAFAFVCDDYGQNLVEINALLGASLFLSAELFDERYLKIEDKAPNPYKQARQKQEDESDSYQRPRHGRHPDRGDRQGGRDQQQGGRSPERGGGANKGPRQDRGGKQGDHREQRHGRGGHDRHRGPQQHSKHGSQLPAPIQPSGGGIFAMIKRIFKAIFG
jgi:ATP-dependent RNA helicase RhlB